MASHKVNSRSRFSTNSRRQPASVTFPRHNGSIFHEPTKATTLSFSTQTSTAPQSTSFTSPRCSEKGCVFPAASARTGKCIYHERQMEEPVPFCSQQPSQLVLNAALAVSPDSEYDASQKRDRLRMAREWEEFQGSGGA